MSETPICDFVKEYIARNPARFHMPGHKGKKILGCEPYDLTEIDGADSLFEASGIIEKSEQNASALFGSPTFYSTEGSSLCIRAMLYLASTGGRGKTVLAARNVHKSFLYAAAALDLDVRWLYPDERRTYLSSTVLPQDIEKALDGMDEKPCCVYLTTPDYLGAGCDTVGAAAVCRAKDVLLLLDCAHGAYKRLYDRQVILKDRKVQDDFDLCCTSAHKTLPVLTGGAYLHIGNAVKEEFVPRAKDALALFASTSPSYLILQSLDAANPILARYGKRLTTLFGRSYQLKRRLHEHGYAIGNPSARSLPGRLAEEYFALSIDDDDFRVVLSPKSYGYTGDELAAMLEEKAVYPEFHDPDYIVFMPTPENKKSDFERLESALLSIPRCAPIGEKAPPPPKPESVMSVREALFSPGERLPAGECLGRVLHDPSVSCPPAVPILMCGERIDEQALACFRYYRITKLSVVK